MTKRPFRIAVVALLIVAVVAAASFGLTWGVVRAATDVSADTLLPAPTLASPTSPSNNPSPQWSFSGVAGATFGCRLTRPDGTTAVDAPCTSPKSYDLTPNPDGTYAFGVRQSDPSGNTSDFAASSYLLDRQAPGEPTFTAFPHDYTSDSTPTWSFTGEPGATFYCELFVGSSAAYDTGGDIFGNLHDGMVKVAGEVCNSGIYTFDLSAYADGEYRLSVYEIDLAGNWSYRVDEYFILDRVAYPPTFQTRPDEVSNNPTASWTFTISGSEYLSVQLTCTLVRNGSAGPVYSGPCSQDKFTFDLTTYPDDTYMLSVTLKDQAGNTAAPATDSFVLDRTIPNVPPTASFTFRCSEYGSQMFCLFDGTSSTDSDGRIEIFTFDLGDGTVQTCPPCNGTYGYYYSALGSYTVTLTVTDSSGATGSVSKLVMVAPDPTPTATTTGTPTATPSGTPTATPSATATPTPTATTGLPTPTLTPAPTSTATTTPATAPTPTLTPAPTSTATTAPATAPTATLTPQPKKSHL